MPTPTLTPTLPPQVGSFNMSPQPGGGKQGPPPVVKKVLSLFGSKREEDKMVGYLSFLKVRLGIGPARGGPRLYLVGCPRITPKDYAQG